MSSYISSHFKGLRALKMGSSYSINCITEEYFGNSVIPLTGFDNIEKLIVNYTDTDEFFWPWIFNSFSGLKNLHVNGVASRWKDPHWPASFWTSLMNEGKHVKRLRCQSMKGFRQSAFKVFASKATHIELLKLVGCSTLDTHGFSVPCVFGPLI
eukprot:TRINITY_DN709_c0_g1_i1.p2 TRINITY_DN709_c0_g1~~TRINITY_DN709_c0_g1_i1.p2  ORF type:complete len:154 (+),score=13.59 TRINITY_DN709_c0_g1_i1:1536-1997(+)